ncbi:hypothetical protein HanPI659440_Chr06g0243451 [Helianthus annuus]|nr:hypothetical protein HanPI659440_Chr06g0243451 [Helianthus annuus]
MWERKIRGCVMQRRATCGKRRWYRGFRSPQRWSTLAPKCWLWFRLPFQALSAAETNGDGS